MRLRHEFMKAMVALQYYCAQHDETPISAARRADEPEKPDLQLCFSADGSRNGIKLTNISSLVAGIA